MPDLSQIAANLNLRFYTRYPFSFTLTFPDTNLTNYTLAAYLQDHRDQKVVDFTITPITLNPGYLSLSLTDEQVAQLDKKFPISGSSTGPRSTEINAGSSPAGW